LATDEELDELERITTDLEARLVAHPLSAAEHEAIRRSTERLGEMTLEEIEARIRGLKARLPERPSK
jgi:hypothetical protein